MDGDGISLAVGSSAVTALVGLGAAWIKARWSKTRVEPDPLNVKTEPKPRYVTCEECKERHRKVDERFAAGNESFKAIRNEIAGMRKDMNNEIAGMRKDVNEGIARINERINDRISPVAEACAANSAAIQIMLKESKP